MPSKRPIETIPVEAFLDACEPPMREIAERLRAIVKAATPEATERVRTGWRLLAYDLPLKRGAFFAWVFPERKHVHLGFPKGVLMDDPRGLMDGAGQTKYARWVTFVPGDEIDGALMTELVLEAARVAVIPKGLGLELLRDRAR
ncbi:MAG: DUF1801 domain-containing protein [Chloroflexota bacterium]